MWILINMCFTSSWESLVVLRHNFCGIQQRRMMLVSRHCIVAFSNFPAWIRWSWRLVRCASCMRIAMFSPSFIQQLCHFKITWYTPWLIFSILFLSKLRHKTILWQNYCIVAHLRPSTCTMRYKMWHFFNLLLFSKFISAKHKHVMLWCRQTSGDRWNHGN